MSYYVIALHCFKSIHYPLSKCSVLKPGHWYNGSVFVLCADDDLFESELTPTSAVLAIKRLAGIAPGGSKEMYITFASTK